MKRLFLVAVAALAAFGCAAVDDYRANRNPYESPFYAKYLNTGSDLDAEIQRTLEAVRQNPGAAELHAALGTLLMEKGFPKDAERELERAINADRRYYPAWYNLGLVRAARGDELGARRAFGRTVALKPGHAAALFQLGLIEEQRHHSDRAVALYMKAFGINPALLDVDVNPRILDSKLTHIALLKLYPAAHARDSMQFAGSPVLRTQPQAQEAASPEAPPQNIVTPAAPPTDPSQQKTPVRPPQ
jgi:tetratricopeptide (TPR) repeat protein